MNTYVEKIVTFTIGPDGRFDVQLWPSGYLPLTGKVYRIRVPVPQELIGETVEAEIEPLQSAPGRGGE
jgi:hypothetical protein